MITIELHRHRIRNISCDGTLYIEGVHICDTTERTHLRVPPGTYRIELQYSHTFGRKVPTLCPGACFAIGNGIYNKHDARILLGTYIAPGCLCLSRKSFMLLYNRINNLQRRGHEVFLEVSE